MPLKRITKSVLLHEGMGDDVDRFLLEPPAVDYVENCRVDKQGVLNKRPGYGPSELTTVPNATGDPFFIHAIGNHLHALTEDGVRSFDGTTWTETATGGQLSSREIVTETPPIGGMGHIDVYPMYDVSGQSIEYYVVTYEIRDRSAASNLFGRWAPTPKHVVIQSYSPDGAFLFQKRIDDARSPKFFPIANTAPQSTVLVAYQDMSLQAGELRYREFNPATGDFANPSYSSLGGIYVNPIYGLDAHSYQSAGQRMLYTRMGASMDGHARYHVVSDPANQRYAVLYQSDGSVYLRTLNNTAQELDTELIVDASDDDTTGEALALVPVSDPTGDGVIVLYARYKRSTPLVGPIGSLARYETAPGINIVPGWGPQDVYGGALYKTTPCHGVLSLDPPGLAVRWMIHDSGYHVYKDQGSEQTNIDPLATRDNDTGIHYGSVGAGDGSESVTEKLIPHHRLASTPVWLGTDLYVAIQQWHDCTPHVRDTSNYNQAASVLGAVAPRTSVVVRIDNSDFAVHPVATLDAGQSKTCEYPESEFQTHLPTAFVDDGDMFFANRVALNAEDMSFRIDDFGNFYTRSGASEAPADAMCRIHKISPMSSVGVTGLGDGVILGGAIPMWFDGRFFGELSPLDQPEIIRIEDSRMEEQNYLPPMDFAQGGDGTIADWRKFQVVVGYYDQRGNKHRSAPSATLYACYLTDNTIDLAGDETNWNGKDTNVYFTMPLTMLPADLEYFVELYASDGPDDDLRLVDTTTIKSGDLDHDNMYISTQLVRDYNDDTYKMPERISAPVYTAGGVLAADPWPDFSIATTTSTRLWAIDSINRGRVIYSKLFEDYIAPEYNSTLAINLGDERNLTAIGKLDDKVVVFEPDDIHVIYGEGPDNRGQGQDFAVHYIATDVGCQDQESVIETPAGLIFYSEPRGFYLLDRNLQVQFIGGGIEDIAYGINIVTATVVPEKAEVRFSWTGGRASVGTKWGPDQAAGLNPPYRPPRPVFYNVPPYLDYTAFSYNYERGTWTVFTNHDAAAATLYQQQYTILRRDWSIWQESTTRFDDPEGDNAMKIVTPWIKLGDSVQGFRRLWRMTFLGRYLSSLQDMGGGVLEAGDINVKVYYDYEAFSTQEKTFRMQDFGFDPFNSSLKRAERLQFQLSPNRGRCQAVKLEITEVNTEDRGEGHTYTLGNGFEITAIDFEIGVEESRPLLPAAVSK